MAKYAHGSQISFVGRIGTLVGSSWNGIPYVKARTYRRKTKSDKEKKCQNNFAVAHNWLSYLIPFLKIGFNGYAERIHALNAAKSYALKNAFVGEGLDKKLDPALIRVSYGDLPLPANITVEKKDGKLHFTWTPGFTNWGDGSHERDQALLLAYDSRYSKTRVFMELAGQFRSTGSDTLDLHGNTGHSFHVFIAFVSHDRSRQSNSMYLGVIES